MFWSVLRGIAQMPVDFARPALDSARRRPRRLSPQVLRLYHVAVHALAHRLLEHIRRRELLRAGERVGVAVSGGIDSVALLRLLLELRGQLGIVVAVVHFNHRLRGAESDGDEEFVAKLARGHDLEFYAERDEVSEHARDAGVSVETAARELRYGFFRSLVGAQGLKPDSSENRLRGPEGPLFHGQPNGGAEKRELSKAAAPKLDKVATGHTLDDQAETVLMRAIRGAGTKGLAGIYPRIAVEDEHGEFCGEIIRPLLAFRRRELEGYLKHIAQGWREDASNSDTSFTRNRVRKLLMPLLEKELNPAAGESLAELAEIARGEEDYWENEVAGWMGTGVHWSEPDWARRAQADLVQIGIGQIPDKTDLQSKIDNAPWLVANASLDLVWLLSEPVAVQRRIVKAIGEHAGFPLEFKHVEEILRFAAEDAGTGKKLSLPTGWILERHRYELRFLTPDLRAEAPAQDYEYALSVPGEISVSETGTIFEVCLIRDGDEAYNSEQFLDAGSLPGPLKVRNWRAGDRYWPNHTKSPKKIKELLQERHIEQPLRKLWPVVVSGDEILWMRGFPAPARFAAKSGGEAIVISEKPLEAASQIR